MTGSILTRITHRCTNGNNRRHQWATPPPRPTCETCKADLRKAERKYVVVYRAGGKQKWKTFATKRAAAKFQTNTAQAIQDGTFTDVKPKLMDQVFDDWVMNQSRSESENGIVEAVHREVLSLDGRDTPASGIRGCPVRDRLSVDEWVRVRADDIAAGTISPKFYNNLVNLLHVILEWARRRGRDTSRTTHSLKLSDSRNRRSSAISSNQPKSRRCWRPRLHRRHDPLPCRLQRIATW